MTDKSLYSWVFQTGVTLFYAVLVLSLLFLVSSFVGCATLEQHAVRESPDGTKYELRQVMRATVGAKLDEGLTDFAASYESDGQRWDVRSGTAGENLESLDIDLLRVLLPVLQALLVSQTPPEPEPEMPDFRRLYELSIPRDSYPKSP